MRTFATLGTFNFSRLAIYKDLDASARSEGQKLENNALIKALLLGSEDRQELLVPKELPEKAFKLSSTPHIIADADSSQLAAVIEAADGKNLVIEGPPGTGKSQTITNIIASLLAAGKSVLFVAEKAAALEVVKKRLSEAGLRDFCLEMHSNKARKSEVLEALRSRIDLKRPQNIAVDKYLSLALRNAAAIETYSDDLHKTYSNLDFTIFKLVWMQERLRHQLPSDIVSKLDSLVIRDAETMMETDLNNLTNLISDWHAQWQTLLLQEGMQQEHPLSFIQSNEMSAQAQHNLRVALDEAVIRTKVFFETLAFGNSIYGETVRDSMNEWRIRTTSAFAARKFALS